MWSDRFSNGYGNSRDIKFRTDIQRLETIFLSMEKENICKFVKIWKIFFHLTGGRKFYLYSFKNDIHLKITSRFWMWSQSAWQNQEMTEVIIFFSLPFFNG